MVRTIKYVMREYNLIKLIIGLILTTFFIVTVNSCELAENPVEPEPTTPTRNVRYLVTMTSSSFNSNPQIVYTNSAGGTSTASTLNLDLTLAIDSGTTVNLSASCVGYYSTISRNSSAGVDLKLFIEDSLAADSSIINTDNISSVSASASVSAVVK